MKDERLELGRGTNNPFNRRSFLGQRLDFHDLFKAKAAEGEYPWNPSRFDERDLVKRAQTRKVTLNPKLNFVGNTPFFDDEGDVSFDFELFEGLGRFNRPFDYDFETGRARTAKRPEEQPDFNPEWMAAYNISPTIKPGSSAKNPMPRMMNPDPNGYLMSQAENRVESEIDDTPSVAQLLARQGQVASEQKAATEEREGAETVKEEKENPETNKG